MIKALDQVAEVAGLGMTESGADRLVPPRRLAELAKYGSVDDTLELLDLLMTTELLNKAQTAADKEKVRKHPKLAKASARLAVAVEALFDSDSWGGPEEEPRVSEVWEAIEAVVSRAELRAALMLVNENVPPVDATDPEDWRSEVVGRYTTVSGFLKLLPKAISFGANAEGAPVLAAMRKLPDVLAYRSRLPAPLIPARLIEAAVVTGPWKRLVFGQPAYEDGAVNRHAYTFCLLEQFTGISSAARSTPTPPPSGAIPRPGSWKARRGRRSGRTCSPPLASRTIRTPCWPTTLAPWMPPTRRSAVGWRPTPRSGSTTPGRFT